MFIECIRLGDLHALRHEMKHGVDIAQRDKNGKSPLYWAVHGDNLAIVKELCTPDTINLTDRYNCTPLFYAVCNSKTEIVKVLLAQEGVDVNAPSIGGDTPLSIALRRDSLEIVKALLDAPGIDVSTEKYPEIAFKSGKVAYVNAVHAARCKELKRQRMTDEEVSVNGMFGKLLNAHEVVSATTRVKTRSIDVVATAMASFTARLKNSKTCCSMTIERSSAGHFIVEFHMQERSE